MKGSELASDAKMAAISVHNAAVGLSIVAVVSVRPQTNNDTISFTKLFESSEAAAANQTSSARLLNWAVDGVSLESNDVWREICDFV